jgi:hypothetical protein
MSEFTKTEYCKICESRTKVVFGISFKAVPICESCARAITKQQVVDMCNAPTKATKD